MFIFRHFFTLVFLVALGLAGHVVWFANTHHGSNPRIDYWPPYCVAAPITTDACALVLSLANYSGQYEYSFGHYTLAGTSVRQLVRIKDGLPMALPVAPGTMDDPDSDALKAECRKVADELQQGSRKAYDYPVNCQMIPEFAKVIEAAKKERDRQSAESAQRVNERGNELQRQLDEEARQQANELQHRRAMQNPYRRGPWTPGVPR